MIKFDLACGGNHPVFRILYYKVHKENSMVRSVQF